MTVSSDWNIRSNPPLISRDQHLHSVDKPIIVDLRLKDRDPNKTTYFSLLPEVVLGVITHYLVDKRDTLLGRVLLDPDHQKEIFVSLLQTNECFRLHIRAKEYNSIQQRLCDFRHSLSSSEMGLKSRVDHLRKHMNEILFYEFGRKINFFKHETIQVEDRTFMMKSSFTLAGHQKRFNVVMDNYNHAVRLLHGDPQLRPEDSYSPDYIPVLSIHGCDYEAMKTIINFYRFYHQSLKKA